VSLLGRASRRHLWRHPWQLVLAVTGVALGVAVAVSIDVANRSALRSFELATEAVAGSATHRIVGGPSGVPIDLLRRLRVDLGLPAVAPVVDGTALATALPGRPLRLLGIDPFAERPFVRLAGAAELHGVDLSRLLTQPATVVIGDALAAELGVAPGDPLALLVGGEHVEVEVVATIASASEAERRALADLLVADVAAAQELLALDGLSHIDLQLSAGEEERVRAVLTADLELELAGVGAAALGDVTRGFRLNLQALSLLALVVGTFLIYNTMTFIVVERRPLVGILRAVGATRRQIFGVVLTETLLIGFVGTLVGLVLGVALATGLVRLVTQTINDLYFVLSVQGIVVPPLALVRGGLLGLIATLVAAIPPALDATTAPLRQVWSRAELEERSHRMARRAAVLGASLVAIGAAGLLVPTRSVPFGLAALMAVISGSALATPWVVAVSTRALAPLYGRAFGVIGRMAARGVEGSLSRTGVAIAALMTAVAVTVGVGVMIASFRATVERWLEATLVADVYVAPAERSLARTAAQLDPAIVERFGATPGVEAVSTMRVANVRSSLGPLELIAVERAPNDRDGFSFVSGDPDAAWRRFAAGEAVFVTEPLAYRHSLTSGDRLTVNADDGPLSLTVASVVYDYGSDRGRAYVGRPTWERHWRDRSFTGAALYLAPGYDPDELIRALRAQVGDADRPLHMRSTRALREASLEIFDRTFRITAVLRTLATVVAFLGVLSALLALTLERAREFAILRANGMTPRQVVQLVMAQTTLMGALAGLLSLPVGWAIAVGMVHVVNRRSFGWSLQLEIEPLILAEAVAVAILAAALAGVIPAIRMARAVPARALRAE